MNLSRGSPEIVIGIIDGPIDFNHPGLQEAKIRTLRHSQLGACKSASSIACMHGTFIAGILCAKRGVDAPTICPCCEVILHPVFMDEVANNNKIFPTSTPEELSAAIVEVIDTGAKVINLSIGLSSSSLITYHKLQQAYDYAVQKGVIIVVAAGNQGYIGNISLTKHQWLIPVVACNENSRPHPMSSFGSSIGKIH
jgi:subtilisin family serine protease